MKWVAVYLTVEGEKVVYANTYLQLLGILQYVSFVKAFIIYRDGQVEEFHTKRDFLEFCDEIDPSLDEE